MQNVVISAGMEGLLWGALIAVAALPVIRHFQKWRDRRNTGEAAFDGFFQIFLLTGAVFFAMLTAAAIISPEAFPGYSREGFIIGFATLTIIAAVSAFDAQTRFVMWGPAGVIVEKWGSDGEHHHWSDIDEIVWNNMLQLWEVRFRDGSSFILHSVMRGARHFVSEAKQRCQLYMV